MSEELHGLVEFKAGAVKGYIGDVHYPYGATNLCHVRTPQTYYYDVDLGKERKDIFWECNRSQGHTGPHQTLITSMGYTRAFWYTDIGQINE